jgi:toxin HigB-1
VLPVIRIRFDDPKLAKLINDPNKLRRKYGDRNAKVIAKRLAGLRAFENLQRVSLARYGRLHPYHGDREGQFAVDLDGAWRLVFVPDYDPIPRLPDDGIDLASITKVVIVEVLDPHK